MRDLRSEPRRDFFPRPAKRGEGGASRVRASYARTSAAGADGYHVLRFWNSDVLRNEEGVLEAILAKLQGRTL